MAIVSIQFILGIGLCQTHYEVKGKLVGLIGQLTGQHLLLKLPHTKCHEPTTPGRPHQGVQIVN